MNLVKIEVLVPEGKEQQYIDFVRQKVILDYIEQQTRDKQIFAEQVNITFEEQLKNREQKTLKAIPIKPIVKQVVDDEPDILTQS